MMRILPSEGGRVYLEFCDIMSIEAMDGVQCLITLKNGHAIIISNTAKELYALIDTQYDNTSDDIR
jgi:hypothetical protein